MTINIGTIVWHTGILEADIWLQTVGDKSSFKMNFQIVNVESANSSQNTFMFTCFEVEDTTTNLYVGLDRFKVVIEPLNGMQCR